MSGRGVSVGLAVLLAAGGLRGEEVKALYTATVVVSEAEVRSGASNLPQMYPTGRLHKGDRVEVVKELAGGWLAIKPPPGSFSWINAKFVQQQKAGQPIWLVVAHSDVRVPLLSGSTIKADKPTVEGGKVKRGTLLRSIGPMRLSDDGYWLPVEPAASEVRYIRADAVSRKPAAESPPAPGAMVGGPPAVLPADPPGPPTAVITPPAAPPAAPGAPTATPASPHPLLLRAQEAEKATRYAEAIQLYRQLSNEVAASNHALSVEALNRAQWLAEATKLQSTNVQGHEVRSPVATTAGRITPIPGGQGNPVAPAGWASSPPGWLRVAGRCIDYRKTYLLETSRGEPILYATAQPGYSLDDYVNRNVELLGVREYRNDLRAYHMTVMQVKPLP